MSDQSASDQEVAALRQEIEQRFANQPFVMSHLDDIERELRRLPSGMQDAKVMVHLRTAFPWLDEACKRQAWEDYELSIKNERDGVPQSEIELAKVISVAALEGHPQAELEMGLDYLNLPTKNYAEAEKWFRKAADQGLLDAQYMLGVLWRECNNDAEAEKWWRMAADQGHALAQTSMGRKYQWGWGVPIDYNEAVRWYLLAVNQGIGDAQNNLGQIYSERDQPQEALKWFLTAANQGHALAQYNVGVYYLRKFNNRAESERWLKMAAQQGEVNAINFLRTNFGYA